MEEFEMKFLEVDVAKLEEKLISIGAVKVAEYNYIRTVFDATENSTSSADGWVRVRTDGKETTLTYKRSIQEKAEDGSIKNIGMTEIEVEVNDYEKACELVRAIGLFENKTEKNKRIRYVKGDIVFDIDFWPFIPVYLEIESDSYEKVRNAAWELDFDPEIGVIGTAGSVYEKYGIHINEYSSVTFEGMIKKIS